MAQVRIKPSMPLVMLQEVVIAKTIPADKKLRELKEQIEIREAELLLLKGWKEQLEALK